MQLRKGHYSVLSCRHLANGAVRTGSTVEFGTHYVPYPTIGSTHRPETGNDAEMCANRDGAVAFVTLR
jgi:hypothetical protein